MFIVRCPECKQTMKYKPVKKGLVTDKVKKCVYCGHSFKIHVNLKDSRIVKDLRK